MSGTISLGPRPGPRRPYSDLKWSFLMKLLITLVAAGLLLGSDNPKGSLKLGPISLWCAKACSFIVCNFDATQDVGSSTLYSPLLQKEQNRNGTFATGAAAPTLNPLLEKANFYSKFRGPDVTNVEVLPDATRSLEWTFLHNLLSMTGNVTLQPFVLRNGGGGDGAVEVAVLFNGEIYNYLDLQEELRTADDGLEEEDFSSDGLVLLPSYKKWGTSFVEHLRGEFAIVLVDFRQGLVLLSTDVFSTKPLWYGTWPCAGDVGHETDETKAYGTAKRTCFAAASYESALKGLGVPDGSRIMADANEVLIFSMQSLSLATSHSALPASPTSLSFVEVSRRPVFNFDLRQHKSTTADWEAAFVNAVRLRTSGIKHRIFIGLSGGFDSGAIMLALKLLGRTFFAYSIDSGEDDLGIIRQRIEYCSESANTTLIKLDDFGFRFHQTVLQTKIEPYQYFSGQYVTDDRASVGLTAILSNVRSRGGLIYMSGSGADETISDYGMNGEKIYEHSCFGGVFPEDLTSIFPWCSFYGGTMRDYLMKEELTGGAHGIETRYPFLDPYVVQEYLWLTADVKNSEYKRPVADFLRKYDFPNMYGTKAGFAIKTHEEASVRDVVATTDATGGRQRPSRSVAEGVMDANALLRPPHNRMVVQVQQHQGAAVGSTAGLTGWGKIAFWCGLLMLAYFNKRLQRRRRWLWAIIPAFLALVAAETILHCNLRQYMDNIDFFEPENRDASTTASPNHSLRRIINEIKTLAVGASTTPQSPPQLLFHFIHTTAESTFAPYRRRAVESVLYHHPDARVIVHSNSMSLKPLRYLVDAGYDVRVQKYDLESAIMATTSVEGELVNSISAKLFVERLPSFVSTEYWYTNQSNILRLCLLYLYGGVYLDTDVIVLRPFDELKNVLGWESPDFANGAILKFEKGNTYIGACINNLLSDFRPDIWGYNGPNLMTRVMQWFGCQGEEGCPVTVLPSHVFQPIPYESIRQQCYEQQTTNVEIMKVWEMMNSSSYAVHWDNSVAGDFWSENVYTKPGTLCEWLFNTFWLIRDTPV